MSKTVEECKKEAIARINRMRASARDPELTKAMNRIGAALERLADVYLYVNAPEGEEGPAPTNLPDGFRGMR
jgi:hypothetical protein